MTSEIVPGDTFVYYQLSGVEGVLGRWPQLWNIVRGQFAWVGNRPLKPSQAARLTNEFERLWLTSRLGLICLADTESGCDVRNEEAREDAKPLCESKRAEVPLRCGTGSAIRNT